MPFIFTYNMKHEKGMMFDKNPALKNSPSSPPLPSFALFQEQIGYSFFSTLFSQSPSYIVFCHRRRKGIKCFILLPKNLSTKISFCPGYAFACASLYKSTGNITEQLEGSIMNSHLERVDMRALPSLSLEGQLSNPKIAPNFLQGIVLHKHNLNSSKALKSQFSQQWDGMKNK